VKLEDLLLADMVDTILRGLEAAMDVVNAYMPQGYGNGNCTGRGNADYNYQEAMMELDTPYEAVDDAMEMDWE
jgi:hypothetical protein